jgi:glycerol-3-phosphate cytidylyltransferase-like family protein
MDQLLESSFDVFHTITKNIGLIELVSLLTTFWIMFVSTIPLASVTSPLVVMWLETYILTKRFVPVYKHFILVILKICFNLMTIAGTTNVSTLITTALFLIVATMSFDLNEKHIKNKAIVLTIIKLFSFFTNCKTDNVFATMCIMLLALSKPLTVAHIVLEVLSENYGSKFVQFSYGYVAHLILVILSCSLYYDENKNAPKYFKKLNEQVLIIGPVMLRIIAELASSQFSMSFVYTLYILAILGSIYKNTKYESFTGFRKRVLCPGLWNGYTCSSVTFLLDVAKYADITIGVYDTDDYEYFTKTKQYVMEKKVRVEIMKNLRCVDDAIIVPTLITDEFLKQNDFDYVIYPKSNRVKQENGIIECNLNNKINC